MATARMRFLNQINTCIIPEIYKEKNEAERNRNCEYSAIVKIQSWYRGAKSRFYLRLLHNAAITIQKHWKGYLARIYYRKYLLSYFENLCLKHFHGMATKIQKIWRGYQSRKKIFDFYKRKAYFKALIEKSQLVLTQLEEFAEHQKDQQLKFASQKHHQFQISQACKEHHLVSTKVIPGIYNSPYRNGNTMETFLQSMEANNTKPLYIGRLPESHRKSLLSPARDLPPVSQKPQGPFRDPKDVQRQRYKPFRPTLRVETDFEHLEKARKEMKNEEWTQRLHDNQFLPVRITQPKYQPLLYTQSPYGQSGYGNFYFRETNSSLQISQKDFKACVPPIPVFDDLNLTY